MSVSALVYEVGCLPDLSLSKYQAFAETGVDGLLDVQTQFLRQLHRVAMLAHVGIHLLLAYDPARRAGRRLSAHLLFSAQQERGGVLLSAA